MSVVDFLIRAPLSQVCWTWSLSEHRPDSVSSQHRQRVRLLMSSCACWPLLELSPGTKAGLNCVAEVIRDAVRISDVQFASRKLRDLCKGQYILDDRLAHGTDQRFPSHSAASSGDVFRRHWS